MTIPYDDIDPPIRPLVRFLNEELMDGDGGVVTTESCGGHKNPAPHQEPEGSWVVVIRLPQSDDEWDAFEFLAWVCHDLRLSGKSVFLDVSAAPPFLNSWITGDSTLGFYLAVRDMPPSDLIDFVRKAWDVIKAGPKGLDDE